MLRKTATITTLLLATLTLNLVAQDRLPGASLDLFGAQHKSGAKAVVLGGSVVELQVTSQFPEAYVAFLYGVEKEYWYGFAVNVTDGHGSLTQTIRVPAALVSGSLQIRALVFDRDGQAISTNMFTVYFEPGEKLAVEPGDVTRARYAPMSQDAPDYAAEKKAMLAAQSKQDHGGTRARLAPQSQGGSMSLADEKRALLGSEDSAQVARVAHEPIPTANDNGTADSKIDTDNGQRARAAKEHKIDTDNGQRARVAPERKIDTDNGQRARLAPQGQGGSMSLADEKRALLGSEDSAQVARVAPEPIPTANDNGTADSKIDTDNGQRARAAKEHKIDTDNGQRARVAPERKIDTDNGQGARVASPAGSEGTWSLADEKRALLKSKKNSDS